MIELLKQERLLAIAVLAMGVALPLEHAALAAGQAVSLSVAVALVGAILLASVRVAHHAEVLAEILGEPYGTMILTLSAVLVEIVILVIVMSHSAAPTLARDTVYSAVMLDINALLGGAALIGGLRHGEQPYNVDSGNSYIVMILTAIGVAMVLPEFIPAAHWRSWSIFTVIVMLLLYALFLRLQTGRHSYFFSYSDAQRAGAAAGGGTLVQAQVESAGQAAGEAAPAAHPGMAQPIAFMAGGIILIGLLSEVMSRTLDAGLVGTGAPPILASLVVAGISASPEILTAMRAALANRMQPVVNIALGATLSTVILTVPVVEALALFTGQPIEMALTPSQTVMVLLTLLAAMINIHDGETNAIEGMTHFVLFAAFLMLTALGI
jgi:Ca2+:H+ antiporter